MSLETLGITALKICPEMNSVLYSSPPPPSHSSCQNQIPPKQSPNLNLDLHLLEKHILKNGDEKREFSYNIKEKKSPPTFLHAYYLF